MKRTNSFFAASLLLFGAVGTSFSSVSSASSPASPDPMKEAVIGMGSAPASEVRGNSEDGVRVSSAVKARRSIEKLIEGEKKKSLRIRSAGVSSSSSEDEGTVFLPEDASIESIEERPDGRLTIRLDGSFGAAPRFRKDRASAGVREELLHESIRGALLGADIDAPFELLLRGEDGEFRSAGDIPTDEELWNLRTSSRRARIEEKISQQKDSKSLQSRFPDGTALAGKRIAISPGHGWWKDGSTWKYQRGNCRASDSNLRGIHEDLFTNEFVSFWLVPLLQNMGAEVVLARNLDHNESERVIIDDGKSGYKESGSGWSAGNNSGGWEGDYRYSLTPGDSASFMHTFSTSGWRRFSTWFLEGTNRPTDAHFTAIHGGGESEVDLNQTKPGRHFWDFGRFWCAAGVPCGVRVSHGSAGGALIADGVMMGGGLYEYTSGSTKPLWHIAAYNYLGDMMGKGTSNLVNDVQARPRFVESVGGADVYIAIHSNAAGSNCTTGATAHGISTYRFNCNGTSAQDSASCDDPPGSKAFSAAIHAAALARIRSDWDANFCNRKEHLDNFGELRLLDTTPGVLMEVAFHDNMQTPQSCSGSGAPKMTDNQAMHDPRWREALAYGLADGFGAYFGTGKAPPPRPVGIRAVNGTSPCELTVSWTAVSGASSYRLYTIENVRPGYERAWDDGKIVRGTSVKLSNLTPGKVYAFQVAAMDKNGEGFPSPAVSVRVLSAGQNVEGLYLNAYDRRDSYVQEIDNDLGYAAEHGIALGSVSDDFYFDGATKDWIENGSMSLTDYAVVDYQAGKNSTEHHSVSAAMQTLLSSYLDAGGKLFISGEEIAFDLGYKNNGKTFLEQKLKASYALDDANVFKMSGVSGSAFQGLSGITFDDGSHGTYEVKYPDGLTPQSGASAAMTYDGTSYTAAVESGSVIFLGTPVETIYPASSRTQVVACAVGRLLKGPGWLCTPSSITAPAGGAPEGTCRSGGDEDAGMQGEDGGGWSDAGGNDSDAGGTSDGGIWQDAGGSSDGGSVVIQDGGSSVNEDSGIIGEEDSGGQPGDLTEDTSNEGVDQGIGMGVVSLKSGCSSASGLPGALPLLTGFSWLFFRRRRVNVIGMRRRKPDV